LAELRDRAMTAADYLRWGGAGPAADADSRAGAGSAAGAGPSAGNSTGRGAT